MTNDIPAPPVPTGDEPKKSGLLSRATQAAKASVDTSQRMKAEREATRAAQAEQDAARAASRIQAYVEAGHRFLEYKVVFVRETLVGDKINTTKLEGTLNQWAQEGWHIRTVTSASVSGRMGPGGVDGLIVTFERALLH